MKSSPVNIQSRLFNFFLSPYLRRLTGRFWLSDQPEHVISGADLDHILERSWQKYFLSVADLEKQANLGNWLVMNFAYLTLSAYQVMLEDGVNQDDAVRKIQQLTWYITSTWTVRAKWLSKYLFKDQIKELQYFVKLVMRTFFSPPGYKFDLGETSQGFYLDVKQCPVAELMISKGASDLCVQSWCGVDFGLVELIGGKLQRHGTLAMGKQKCDFVFQSDHQNKYQSISG